MLPESIYGAALSFLLVHHEEREEIGEEINVFNNNSAGGVDASKFEFDMQRKFGVKREIAKYHLYAGHTF